MQAPVILVYEDRPRDLVGVRLLLASLAEHEPEARVHVMLPDCSSATAEALSRILPAAMIDTASRNRDGWNAKPRLLAELLDGDASEVLWLDSDIVLTSPLTPLLGRYARDDLVLAEEPAGARYPGSIVRTEGWGLTPGIERPATLNTAVVRVSRKHRPLINAWSALLARADYRAAQQLPWHQRPSHFMGDQDALTALLGSMGFDTAPIGLLRSGVDIAHCFNEDGFSVRARLAHAFRNLPPLVHAQGEKPWSRPGKRALHLQVSPYVAVARRYPFAFDAADRRWLAPDRPAAHLLAAMVFRDPALSGILPAAWRTSVRALGRAAKASLIAARTRTRSERARPCVVPGDRFSDR